MSEKHEPKAEIVTRQPETGAEPLLRMAVEQKMDIQTIEKLMAMRRELKAETAKEAFDSAMAKFQASCPVIQKTSKVMQKDGRNVRYHFASLDQIITQIREPLRVSGLSFQIKSSLEADPSTKAGWVRCVCIVKHSAGHAEESEFKIPVLLSEYMSPQQSFASANTYAKRYAFLNAFGIMTGDMDDDGQKADANKHAPSDDDEPRQYDEPPLKEGMTAVPNADAKVAKEETTPAKKPKAEKVEAPAEKVPPKGERRKLTGKVVSISERHETPGSKVKFRAWDIELERQEKTDSGVDVITTVHSVFDLEKDGRNAGKEYATLAQTVLGLPDNITVCEESDGNYWRVKCVSEKSDVKWETERK
jgi:hypothetical protein